MPFWLWFAQPRPEKRLRKPLRVNRISVLTCYPRLLERYAKFFIPMKRRIKFSLLLAASRAIISVPLARQISMFRRLSLLLLVSCCSSFGFAVAGDLPEIRPALVGSSPKALINLIDSAALIRKGQGSGAVWFFCHVMPNGQSPGFHAYGGTPNSEELRKEVIRCLDRARFIPAVYNHRKTYAIIYGTVVFANINGKPRLRIFANQEKSEIARESDFISPQSIAIPGHHYDYVPYPGRSQWSDDRPATVELLLTVDASGNVKDLRVAAEHPAGGHFGESALASMRQMTFLPAFRNGRPVDSTTHRNFVFIPGGWRWDK